MAVVSMAVVSLAVVSFPQFGVRRQLFEDCRESAVSPSSTVQRALLSSRDAVSYGPVPALCRAGPLLPSPITLPRLSFWCSPAGLLCSPPLCQVLLLPPGARGQSACFLLLIYYRFYRWKAPMKDTFGEGTLMRPGLVVSGFFGSLCVLVQSKRATQISSMDCENPQKYPHIKKRFSLHFTCGGTNDVVLCYYLPIN